MPPCQASKRHGGRPFTLFRPIATHAASVGGRGDPAGANDRAAPCDPAGAGRRRPTPAEEAPKADQWPAQWLCCAHNGARGKAMVTAGSLHRLQITAGPPSSVTYRAGLPPDSCVNLGADGGSRTHNRRFTNLRAGGPAGSRPCRFVRSGLPCGVSPSARIRSMPVRMDATWTHWHAHPYTWSHERRRQRTGSTRARTSSARAHAGAASGTSLSDRSWSPPVGVADARPRSRPNPHVVICKGP
jgi:hypothetical protein